MMKKKSLLNFNDYSTPEYSFKISWNLFLFLFSL